MKPANQEPSVVAAYMMELAGGVSAGLGVSLLTHSSVKTWEEAGKIRCFRVPERFRYSVVSFVYRRDLFRTSAFDKFAEQILRTPRLVRKEKK
ncbi:LysR substrate-binding domain-containing protein [Paenibacillus sp.]|jgi:DNA-binding transcriptional LysR family regulator|uniref:LysR substrate-binding domain-containing protein n=1 Tax=Paenibacillus sp. TaxID=58172 RepID=UPI00283851D5|nr:LysR substrate-binding domain-containing protein [Paenibacillus sp.]MDR0267321.1 hypothetical protein [Paenibacillus sp.]